MTAGRVNPIEYVGRDGLVNYAQWASPADFEAMMKDPKAGEHMNRASEIAESFDPNLYRVASVHHTE